MQNVFKIKKTRLKMVFKVLKQQIITNTPSKRGFKRPFGFYAAL
jgi:hypothetical protein